MIMGGKYNEIGQFYLDKYDIHLKAKTCIKWSILFHGPFKVVGFKLT